MIPHGVLDDLARRRGPAPLFAKTKPVVLFFGLIRPYKGVDVLLEAWRARRRPDAELWVVGMPRMDASLHRTAPSVRTALRFVSGAELAGAFGPPTSSCCPTARSTSPACCSPRWRSASRCC